MSDETKKSLAPHPDGCPFCEIVKLHAQLDAVMKDRDADKELLDWMERSQFAMSQWKLEGEGRNFHIALNESHAYVEASSARAVIRAAIAAEKGTI